MYRGHMCINRVALRGAYLLWEAKSVGITRLGGPNRSTVAWPHARQCWTRG